MEKIRWTNHKKKFLKIITECEERTKKRRKAQWIGYIVRGKCLVKQVTEGTIEGMGGRWKRRKQLLDGLY
jgi:hypothetical protein